MNQALFAKAFAAIEHYGRDGSISLVDGNVALGQHHFKVARRTCPERQPAQLDRLTLVADAILDNRAELCAKLAIATDDAARLGDSQIILRAYRKWGRACLDHLLGDYAIAVWDAADRSLFLARDHIGTRPLFWRQHQDVVLFGSDIRALLAMDDLPWRIDPRAVAEYLAEPNAPMSAPFFEGLAFVPPGSWTLISDRGPRTERWWDPAKIEAGPPLKDGTAYAQRLRELVEDAVAACIDTDLPVGSHISGGIDSTTVTLLAQRQLKKDGRSLVAAYTWAPEVSAAYPDFGPRDERRAVSHVADSETIPVRWGTLSEEAIWQLLDRNVEVFGTVDLADEFPVLEKAGADGISLMLSGWGGDEAFSAKGVTYPASLLSRRQFRPLAHLLRTRARKFGTRSALRLLRDHAIRPLLPSRFALEQMSVFDTRQAVHGSLAPPRETGKELRRLPDVQAGIRRLLLHGHIGARMTNWAALSAHKGYRYRYPLTDRRILEFVCGIPDRYFVEGAIFRSLAYKAISDLPFHLMRKTDTANERLRATARRDFARAALADRSRTALLDPRFVSQLAGRLRTEEGDAASYDTGTDIQIYRLITALRVSHLIEN